MQVSHVLWFKVVFECLCTISISNAIPWASSVNDFSSLSMYIQKCWIIYLALKLIPCLCHTFSFVIVVFSICQNLHNFTLNLQKNEEKNKTRQLNYDSWQKKPKLDGSLSGFFSRIQLNHWSKNTWTMACLLGGSGGVVNSPDFCPISLKSLGCFYFRCVLSSQWKVVTVNLRILHCQL